MISVVILSHNEERHISRAIRSVAAVASQVLVVDSGSSDRTTEVAEALGALVLRHPFVNQAAQFNWALDNAPITSDWIMRLDADEVIEPDLATEIARKLPLLPSDVVAVNLKRKHVFMDRWIRHGGRWPLVLTRIWRRGHARVENRWMDEHVIVTGGSTVTFEGGFADHNLNDLTVFTEKHNRYATREAVDALNQRHALFPRDETLADQRSQASVRRRVKERVYNKLPFPFAATSYFLYRYILQLGFLDGMPGLIYHFLQGFWYRFLVGSKVYELEREIAALPDAASKRQRLTELTGLKLD